MSSKGASEAHGQPVHREPGGQSSYPQPSLSQPQPNLLDLDHGVSTPPPYSGPSTPQPQSSQVLPPQSSPHVFPGLPKLNYGLYCPPHFKLSPDETTITINKPEPSTYPAVLNSLVQAQATIPPKVIIRVTGTSASGMLDFDVKINMMSLFVGSNDPSERWNYIKLVDDGELAYRGGFNEAREPLVDPNNGLGEWVRKYCADSSAIKQFTIERTVANWDTSYLEGRIHSLIAATSYRGRVVITFPMTHCKVLIRSPDRVSRLWTNVTSLFSGTKRYEVVKIIWPYASVPPDNSDRKFAVQSEGSWWKDWEDAIRHAVLSRRRGWVTVEDRLEYLMAPKKDKLVVQEWGTLNQAPGSY